jgi:predicted nucleic acid-binding protein
VAAFLRKAGKDGVFLSVMTIATAKQHRFALAVVDGVIAATALEHDLTIVTRNTKDFTGLGASLLNPWDAV